MKVKFFKFLLLLIYLIAIVEIAYWTAYWTGD